MERIGRDFCEGLAGGSAIGTRADLNHVVAAAAADLVLVVISRRIAACDAPGLDRRIPDAKRRAVHVHGLVQVGSPIRTLGHDPDILHGAAFKHQPKCASPLMRCADTSFPQITVDIRSSTPDQRSVGVRSFRDFGCSTVSGQYGEQSSHFCNFNRRHSEHPIESSFLICFGRRWNARPKRRLKNFGNGGSATPRAAHLRGSTLARGSVVTEAIRRSYRSSLRKGKFPAAISAASVSICVRSHRCPRSASSRRCQT
jgi:hypothetical protein